MHDINLVRADPAAFDAALAHRNGVPFMAAGLLELDDKRKAVITRLEIAQARRNTVSKLVAEAKRTQVDAGAYLDEMRELKTSIQVMENERKTAEAELAAALAQIPNLPWPDVPRGAGEEDNLEYTASAAGRPVKPTFDFAPKEHFEIGSISSDMDFETAAQISGSRFVVLRGQLARLERALGQFMLDLHVDQHGYTEIAPPVLVRDPALLGTGQLPKFEEDLYFTAGPDRLALIPTAEVPLTNLVREKILTEQVLPLRFVALTPCFRSEAGAAGRDVRGMLRQHQFNKVELVSITTPDSSNGELERMLGCAEAVLQRLGLHYRVMTLSTGDMGFSAQKTYDVEVWLPGQNRYREISSCSVCGDFQARRMDARFRNTDGRIGYVHTLNGSALAVGRTLIAVIENYQQADGSVRVPDALLPYLNDQPFISF